MDKKSKRYLDSRCYCDGAAVEAAAFIDAADCDFCENGVADGRTKDNKFICKKCMEVPMASTFEKELADIMLYVEDSIAEILLSKDRTEKHKPYTWLDESDDEHLRKASRHILTHQLIRDGQQPDDLENHLNNAICRLAMAIAAQRIKTT